MSPPVLQAPPSKSLTHRALLLAALSDAPSVVHNPGLGADNRSTLGALAAWGARFEIDERGPVPCVRFEPFEPRAPEAALDCGNSGTTLRFLLGQAARFPFETTLTGDESLQTRPNGPLLAALLDLGATVDSRDTRAPVTICGPLLAGDMTLRGGLSSQFASSLMLALALSRGPAALRLLPPIASRPYLDLTLAVADDFRLGFEVEDTSEGGLLVKIPGGRRPRGREYLVEGDWSGAAFPMVAAALVGEAVEVEGVTMESRQGDRAIVEFLRASGATIEATEAGVRVSGRAHRSPGTLDVRATPDLFPVLVALAASVPGTTRIHGSPGLRHKECDRISAMAEAVSRMGGTIHELDDGAIVHGTPDSLAGTSVHSHDDHRIHMALSVLGLVARGPTRVSNPECVDVSYPRFHEDLAAIKAHATNGGSR
jgi:3-phosphoshikimate 1-carboxyvinyltransferase